MIDPDPCLEAWFLALGPMAIGPARDHPSGLHPIEGRMDLLRRARRLVAEARGAGLAVPFADALDALRLDLLDRLLVLSLLREEMAAHRRPGLLLFQLCDAAGAASFQQQERVRRRLEEEGTLRSLGLVQCDADPKLDERLYRLPPGWKEALLAGRAALDADDAREQLPPNPAARAIELRGLARLVLLAAAPDPRERLYLWAEPYPERPGWNSVAPIRRSLVGLVSAFLHPASPAADDPISRLLSERGVTTLAEALLFAVLLPRGAAEPPVSHWLVEAVLEGVPRTPGVHPSKQLLATGLVELGPEGFRVPPGVRARCFPSGLAPERGIEEPARESRELTRSEPFDRIQPSVKLGDVVLAPAVRERLEEALAVPAGIAAAREAWGLDDSLLGTPGVALLLHGPPGTGKTLSAEAIAGELGRALWRVRSDRLLSKYIGETEKAIAAVFAAARTSGDVVLVDEADSFLARRTDEARSWEVSATNTLLQEIERFPGVVVLTTNRDAALDPALERRLLARLELGPPAEAERLALWRRHLPPAVPLADDVDLAALARRHPLTGSGIRTAALHAVARAARRAEPDRRVTRADLDEAAAVQAARQAEERPAVGFLPPAPSPHRLSLVAGPEGPARKESR